MFFRPKNVSAENFFGRKSFRPIFVFGRKHFPSGTPLYLINFAQPFGLAVGRSYGPARPSVPCPLATALLG